MNTDLMSTGTRHARALFAGIAAQYEWMGAALSFGQDPRWRRFLVSRIAAPRGSGVLDVASGTGPVGRALERRGYRVIELDASEAMLRTGAEKHACVLARAEALPFADVRGSTELASELDPEEWHRIMDRFFQILTDGFHRFEGTVNQFTQQ